MSCVPSPGSCQTWVPMGYPLEISNIYSIYPDTATNALFIAGLQIINYATDSNRNVVMRFQNGIWDTIAQMDQPARTMVRYNDTLIVGGAFSMVNDSAISRITFYDNGVWRPYGQFPGGVINELKVINGTLYAVGNFNSCDDHPATGIAYRNGTHWENLGTISMPQPLPMNTITEYNGNLVVGGNFTSTAGFSDLATYINGEWQPVGPSGLLGGISAVYALAVYNDDLIIGGTISIAAGNAGHAIMGWNGAEFYALNIGPQLILESYQYYYRVNALLVHQGKLVAGGGFQYADLVPASRIAVWDGQVWCGLGTEIGDEVRALALHGDSLIVATWGDQTFDGVDMNNLAVYTGTLNGDTCGMTTSIDEQYSGHGYMVLHPNPTTGLLHVELNGLRPRELWVSDALGRVLLRQALPGTAQGTLPLDLAALGPGAYLVTVVDAEGMRHTQRVVRE